MDAEDRLREPMTDEAVDRELQVLLAVDPSPEFVARVRTRIANEPEPSQFSVAGLQLPTASAWWLSWKLACVVAGPVIVLAVILTRWNQPSTIEAGSKGPALPTPQTQTASAPEAGRHVPTVEATSRRPGPFGPGEAELVVASQEPEIMLDARETAALRALIRGVRRGDLDLEPVLRASAPSVMDLPPVTEITIAPITIAPLVDEGVRP
jgi:hypothetical protein